MIGLINYDTLLSTIKKWLYRLKVSLFVLTILALHLLGIWSIPEFAVLRSPREEASAQKWRLRPQPGLTRRGDPQLHLKVGIESLERERVEKGGTFIWLLPAAGEVGAEDAFCFLFQACVWALHTFIMHFVVHANACIELCKTRCVRVYWFPSLRVELSFTLCLLSLYKWMHICFSIWERAYSVLNHQPRAHFLSCHFLMLCKKAGKQAWGDSKV